MNSGEAACGVLKDPEQHSFLYQKMYITYIFAHLVGWSLNTALQKKNEEFPYSTLQSNKNQQKAEKDEQTSQKSNITALHS